ncbi:hypothetical protein [Woodsholea maritima]|uniref:hypothetical protein n=1 Tax=Woodsholea maritima TaxID=240237 RepID=UPI0003714C83|nr:hypothetical protein [Woodsholea maritima]
MTCIVNPANLPAIALNAAVIKVQGMGYYPPKMSAKPVPGETPFSFESGFVEIEFIPDEGTASALIERVEAAGYVVHDVEWPSLGEQNQASLGLFVTQTPSPAIAREMNLHTQDLAELIRAHSAVISVRLMRETRHREGSRL